MNLAHEYGAVPLEAGFRGERLFTPYSTPHPHQTINATRFHDSATKSRRVRVTLSPLNLAAQERIDRVHRFKRRNNGSVFSGYTDYWRTHLTGEKKMPECFKSQLQLVQRLLVFRKPIITG